MPTPACCSHWPAGGEDLYTLLTECFCSQSFGSWSGVCVARCTRTSPICCAKTMAKFPKIRQQLGVLLHFGWQHISSTNFVPCIVVADGKATSTVYLAGHLWGFAQNRVSWCRAEVCSMQRWLFVGCSRMLLHLQKVCLPYSQLALAVS